MDVATMFNNVNTQLIAKKSLKKIFQIRRQFSKVTQHDLRISAFFSAGSA